ncbi:MAG: class I SAM-dependent methyltransferase [Gammaproteobacteria bacterium]|nr:class I SAM-dependent methyltransferase [Gammaproteobacteria bacterium]
MAKDDRLGDNNYGDKYAAVYDDLFANRDDVSLVTAVLHELAGNGDIIEFGVGTGRLAIPLSQRGHRVYGVDNSQVMLDALKAKPGSQSVTPVLGDFGTVAVGKPVALVFSAFSTIYLLGTPEAQLQNFRNAAAHLAVGGRFIVEAFVHDRTRFINNQQVVATEIGESHATVQISLLEPAKQIIRTQQMTFTPAGISFLPNRLRFIYPAEMDLMAQLAGMALEYRWRDWERRPFEASSTNQIAVYTKVVSVASAG